MRNRGGTETRDFRIVDLLEMIDAQEMVLPEFQRDFDWADERVQQLLATIARRWPAGSLLLQQLPGSTFYELREFDGGPRVNRDVVEYVVLDGQQRLTALYHAIYDAGPYVYAISASALGSTATIDQLEDGIRSFVREEWNQRFRDRQFSADNDWIPFYALRSPTDFFGWRDAIVRRSDAELGDETAETISKAYREGLEAFHTYMIPAVIVERDLEAEAIARIFERVNRGGLTLTAFDLMVAKTFEPGWNLREKWNEARSRYPLLDAFFGEDGMPVIRVIALKANSSVRERDVLGLLGLAVRQDWDAAVRATSDAVEALYEVCGVRDPSWLPYGGMVISLAAIAYEFDLNRHRELVREWFLSRGYSLRYDTAANTVTVEEYSALREALVGSADLRQWPIVERVIEEATRKRRGALWRTYMATLAMQGALDPITGEPVSEPRPVAVLSRSAHMSDVTEPPHLLILNIVLVDRANARAVDGMGADSFAQLTSQLPPEVAKAVLASQLLPTELDGDPELFIAERSDRLFGFLRSVLGSNALVTRGVSPGFE